jgi:hypothetical protein
MDERRIQQLEIGTAVVGYKPKDSKWCVISTPHCDPTMLCGGGNWEQSTLNPHDPPPVGTFPSGESHK